MIRLLFLAIIMLSSWTTKTMASVAVESEQPGHLRVLEVDGAKIYTASLILHTGETAYFSCEPITNEERSRKWGAYCSETKRMTDFRRGLFLAPFQQTAKDFTDNMNNYFPKKTIYKAEFLSLIQKVYDTKRNEAMMEALESIGSGCNGMHYSVGGGLFPISRKSL